MITITIHELKLLKETDSFILSQEFNGQAMEITSKINLSSFNRKRRLRVPFLGTPVFTSDLRHKVSNQKLFNEGNLPVSQITLNCEMNVTAQKDLSIFFHDDLLLLYSTNPGPPSAYKAAKGYKGLKPKSVLHHPGIES
jgi:hypothetical protein